MKRSGTAMIMALLIALMPFGCMAGESSTQSAFEGVKVEDHTGTAGRTEGVLMAQADTVQMVSAAPAGATAGKTRPAATAAAAVSNRTPDSSQIFTVGSLPEVITINPMTLEPNTADMQPRLKYLRITGLKVNAADNSVEFSIENDFNRTNAKAVHLGGFMLTGLVRYGSDNGAALHNCILLRQKRVVLEKGATSFRTDPATYSQVARIEKLQFFIMPPSDTQVKSLAANESNNTGNLPDTSQQFTVGSLPPVIAVDRYTVEQHGAENDPRLGYLKIKDLRVVEDGKTIEFIVENSFERSKADEPIHVGGLLVTGMARYDYDGGAELHSAVLFKEKRMAFTKGTNRFRTDASLYPNVTKVETLQFYITPK